MYWWLGSQSQHHNLLGEVMRDDCKVGGLAGCHNLSEFVRLPNQL